MKIFWVVVVAAALLAAPVPASADEAPAVRDASPEVSADVAEGGDGRDMNASIAQYLPRGLFERYAAVFAVLLSAVALGIQRKQPWALKFAGDLGRSQVRVKGYLLPVNRPGIITPRPIVGLENAGLPKMRVGKGTPHMSYVKNTILEFEGTTDGSPPDLVVELGQVTVNGQTVTQCHLNSGDVIEAEGVSFKYMRGNRR